MPKALLGLGSYAATAILAAMEAADRVQRQPWIPVALGAKVLVDAVQAGKVTWEQWARQRAFCFWCLLAAGATWATLPLALPEASVAVRRLLGQGWTR
jgi:uncharacterized membrane protein